MTEGYRAREDCPFLARYILKKNLSPLRLSNLCHKTTIRQLGQSRTANNTNLKTEAKAEAESRDKSEAKTEAKAEGQVWDPDMFEAGPGLD